MSAVQARHNSEYPQRLGSVDEIRTEEDLDSRVSQSALSRFGQSIASGAKSLGNYVVRAVRWVGHWIYRAYQAIFGGSDPQNEDLTTDSHEANSDQPSILDSLVGGDDDDDDQAAGGPPLAMSQSTVQDPDPEQPLVSHPVTTSSAALIPFSLPQPRIRHPLQSGSPSLEPMTPVSIRARLMQTPQLIFRIGNAEYWLQNPLFENAQPDRQAMAIFRQSFAEIMKVAAEQPYYDMQVGENMVLRLQNPGYGRAIDGEALQQHTVHQVQALMSKENSQALVSTNSGHGACSCRFCAQNQTVLGSEHYQFQIGSELVRLDNPFRSPTPPSDERVFQFNIDLGRILERARREGSFAIGLSDGPMVQISLNGNRAIESGQFGQLLLTVADAQRLDPIAREALALPAPSSSKQPVITLPAPQQGLSIYPTASSSEERAVSKPAGKHTQSLQELAAQAYASTSSNASDVLIDQSRFPALGNQNGRNRLLYYIDESTTVWNEPPVSLGEAVQYCVDLSNSGIELSEEQKTGIRVFFNKLKAARHFDLPFYLNGKMQLQRILSPRLDELLKIAAPNREQQLEIDLAKAELATSFNYGIVRTEGGANGAVFIKTFEGRPVGVFKAPHDLGIFDFVEKMKQYFGQARLLSGRRMVQEEAEVIAGDLSRFLGFGNMAPEAIMANFGGEEGAFIAFLDGYKELSEIKEDFDSRDDYTKEEVLMWQMKEIWNKLIGNLDPHDDNVFVKGTGERVEQISMIDAGNSFPEYNPGYFGSRGNLAASASYNITKRPFLPEVCAFITRHITEERVEQFIHSSAMRQGFFSEKMRLRQMERVRLLRRVASGVIETPVQLAMIQTDNDYARYLRIAE